MNADGGAIQCLSFHETKNIISGEGGALLVNNPQFVERAEIIREKGTNRNKFFRGEVDKYTWVDIGSSFLPSELVGAFLYAQLEEAEKIIAARCRIFQRYRDLLQPLEKSGFFRLPALDDKCVNNGHIFSIITRSLRERTQLIEYLKTKGILAIFHYIPLHSSHAGKKYGRVSGEMGVTNDLCERIVRLPMYYEMSNEDVDRVSGEVQKFYMR
jgi:dTDP-4-amino-4,6-dideoxygalactose transaminase